MMINQRMRKKCTTCRTGLLLRSLHETPKSRICQSELGREHCFKPRLKMNRSSAHIVLEKNLKISMISYSSRFYSHAACLILKITTKLKENDSRSGQTTNITFSYSFQTQTSGAGRLDIYIVLIIFISVGCSLILLLFFSLPTFAMELPFVIPILTPFFFWRVKRLSLMTETKMTFLNWFRSIYDDY